MVLGDALEELVGVPLGADVDLEAEVLEVLDALGGELLLDQYLLLFGHLSHPSQSMTVLVMNTCSAAPTEAPNLTSYPSSASTISTVLRPTTMSLWPK